MQNGPDAEEPILDDPEGHRYRENMTGRLYQAIDRFWPIIPQMQELRRRLGLTRGQEKLSDIYHTVYFIAQRTYQHLAELGDLEEKFPEVDELCESAIRTFRDLAETVEAVLRGTGMWKIDARYMGHELRPNERTTPNELKW